MIIIKLPISKTLRLDTSDLLYISIRDKKLKRSHLFGSNFYQVAERINTLLLPGANPKIIRAFHLYYPFPYALLGRLTKKRRARRDYPIPRGPVPNEYTKGPRRTDQISYGLEQ